MPPSSSLNRDVPSDHRHRSISSQVACFLPTSHIYMHTHTCIHTCTHIYMHTHMHTHTHTCIHTHTSNILPHICQCVCSSVVGGCEIDHWIAFGVWSSAGGVVGSLSTMPSSKAPFKCLCFDTVSKMSMFRFSDFRIFDTAV